MESKELSTVTEPKTPSVSFSDLPTEIVSHILSFLPTPGSFYPCLLVSHRFHSLVLPQLYRNLKVPFISHNRLVTLIRAIRRFSHLGERTQTLVLGEHPFDTKRSLERIIGGNDITKLWPCLRKVEIYAMTFERSMMYRFFAYCSRAAGLEELVVHYPDLIPLMQPIKGLRRLTWSFTALEDSPIFFVRGGVEETEWVQMKFLERLAGCCPELEGLTLGCADKNSQWGINDRRDLEMDEGFVARDLEKLKAEVPKLAKLKEFEWMANKEVFPIKHWERVAEAALEGSKDTLEKVKWSFSLLNHDNKFLEKLPSLRALKSLSMQMPYDDSDNPATDGLNSKSRLARAIENWQSIGLREFNIRFSYIGFDCENETRILRALEKANGLNQLSMTFGRPSPRWAFSPGNFAKNDHQIEFGGQWYHDEKIMRTMLNCLPSSLDSVLIDFDNKDDSQSSYLGSYEYTSDDYEFTPEKKAEVTETSTLPWERGRLDKLVLFDLKPNLKKAHVGWYDIVRERN